MNTTITARRLCARNAFSRPGTGGWPPPSLRSPFENVHLFRSLVQTGSRQRCEIPQPGIKSRVIVPQNPASCRDATPPPPSPFGANPTRTDFLLPLARPIRLAPKVRNSSARDKIPGHRSPKNQRPVGTRPHPPKKKNRNSPPSFPFVPLRGFAPSRKHPRPFSPHRPPPW